MNSKVFNFTSLRNMILEEGIPLYVHNPRKIKRKHGKVVGSEPAKRSTKLFLRSAGFWTTLSPFRMAMINLFTLFIFIYIYRYIYLTMGFMQLFSLFCE
jgi:hypothetical protein